MHCLYVTVCSARGLPNRDWPGSTERLEQFLIDVGLAMGNLLGIVKQQSKAQAAKKR